MSKRRNRKKSSQANLPQETLARARREAGLVDEEITEEADAAEAPEVPVAAPDLPPAPARTRSAETLPPVQRRSSRRREKEVDVSQLSQEEIAERLANPTRTVTEEQLREQYTYVISDLRSMGVLAGLLFVVMILAAQFLGR